MKPKHSRREFLKLSGMAGIVFSTGLLGATGRALAGKEDEFYFVQFTDTHYGFNKKKINPDPVAGLEKAIDKVNGLKEKPDFIIFTGDLTHSVDDRDERRKRMLEFKKLISRLENRNIKFIPGEHDASLDNGEVYKEIFGETHYFFKHKGVNFVALDNVSNPRGIVGEQQLQWLDKVLSGLDKSTPLVVFAHRPLFALYPQWGWSTGDGESVIRKLSEFKYVNVFYGHIHQEHEHRTDHILHRSARSLIFPLPAPGTAPQRKPLPWDAKHPYKGLGVRNIESYGDVMQIDDIDVS